jgi:hypothetical protein
MCNKCEGEGDMPPQGMLLRYRCCRSTLPRSNPADLDTYTPTQPTDP